MKKAKSKKAKSKKAKSKKVKSVLDEMPDIDWEQFRDDDGLEADEDEYNWILTLEQAEETGDLRELLILLVSVLVSGNVVPDWVVGQIAQLFAIRRLSPPRRSSSLEPGLVLAAHFAYVLCRKSGGTSRDCVEQIAKRWGVSEQSLLNRVNPKGGRGRKLSGDNKRADDAEKLEQKLHELLKR
jgi:hypothetical protein